MESILLSSFPSGPDANEAIPIRAMSPEDWSRVGPALSESERSAAALAGFAGKLGELALVPGPQPTPSSVLFGLGDGEPPAMAFRGLAARLPEGTYSLDGLSGRASAERAALAWVLGAYRFDRYRQEPAKRPPKLLAPAGIDADRVRSVADACALARDMVNTPANDMGPLQIETVCRDLAARFGAGISVTVGDDLLVSGYPAVHAVGRAAAPDRAPRMIELTWGRPDKPVVAVIGKGVTFDTGGLDLKPSSAMRLMKKDMGGAAHAIGLAQMVMALNLPVRLVLLIPAVENAVSGAAMRPGDVLASRKGLSIEVGNTDAEGRLILADALVRAGELNPDLTVDLATLTGAARVALGPQVIPFYTSDDGLAAELSKASAAVEDPLWRMPLWEGYVSALDSDIADLKNDADPWAQAGSITAALFLKRFAPPGAWAHFDIFAWNPRSRPGWPVGAEAQAIRAVLAVLEARYR